jgi:hypothetical protein
MPTLFEGILAGQQANLNEQRLRLGAIQESNALLGLRDRVAETFAFESLINNGLDPLSAISAAQSQVPIGAFRSLSGTELGVLGGQLGLQGQQIQNNLANRLFSQLNGGRNAAAPAANLGAFTNSNALIDSLLNTGRNNNRTTSALNNSVLSNTGSTIGSTGRTNRVTSGNFANDVFSP